MSYFSSYYLYVLKKGVKVGLKDTLVQFGKSSNSIIILSNIYTTSQPTIKLYFPTNYDYVICTFSRSINFNVSYTRY